MKYVFQIQLKTLVYAKQKVSQWSAASVA